MSDIFNFSIFQNIPPTLIYFVCARSPIFKWRLECLIIRSSLQHNISRSFCLVLKLWKLSQLLSFFSWLHQKKKISALTFVFALTQCAFVSYTYFATKKDVTNRKLHGFDIRFHNTRTRQKERKILNWRLLSRIITNKTKCFIVHATTTSQYILIQKVRSNYSPKFG